MLRGQRIIQATLFVGILYFYIPTTGFRAREIESPGAESAPNHGLAATSLPESKSPPNPKSLAFSNLTPISFEKPVSTGFNEGMQLYIQEDRDGTLAPWRGASEKWEVAQTLAGEQAAPETKTLPLSFLGSTDTHLDKIDLLMQLHRQEPDAGYDGKGLHTSTRTQTMCGGW